MKQSTDQQSKDRGSLTLAELLMADRGIIDPALLPTGETAVPNLTIPVRDWLTKYVAGEKPPYADLTNPDDYDVIEWIVSVLADRAVATDNEMLPQSAIDYVEEWLYRLEEATDLHVWDVPDIARPFLAHVFALAANSDSTEGGKEALESALSQLCTQDELTRFYERHDLNRKVERTAYKGSQAGRDRQVAIKAARVIADPSVSAEIKEPILDAINELGMATSVSCLHPALIERALTLMFESKDYTLGKAEAQKDRKKLRELVAAVPVSEQTHQPDNFKERK